MSTFIFFLGPNYFLNLIGALITGYFASKEEEKSKSWTGLALQWILVLGTLGLLAGSLIILVLQIPGLKNFLWENNKQTFSLELYAVASIVTTLGAQMLGGVLGRLLAAYKK